ncbi:bifunctional DNA-formamidopyrimidine glycosylase/DNA-(apurinic or apyrimidinic site) lyase [Parvularcula sp. LCG005]|uniref:bifunctional DNA-formamidopyrimidine glycosylase/DNA-(apurinic or apyrimidinic site) lyase n=1 Tax=Parvularcula sp. LCG005 TaxID=3078805 RepID=UPI0029431D9A|nr:bifunctional DNA-formamidopyrimidine glycosylase/DNA-(apurinic or apyrimidinic site) lyase [Parvularcula sp. LCG005]WOI53916.1 bifunctional DNA-formamidopyrimidine glycosylase/DNA-(apurinic or apyrimidinic site) lyase [Parvularcula sp. LCG005]
MPELPEVETVRRGLAPYLTGARLNAVHAFRPDLRFPLPDHFRERLQGQRIVALRRRAKYLVADLTLGESLIMHLGMSGRFTVVGEGTPGVYVQQVAADRHVHVRLDVDGGSAGPATINYADPRRFGFMDIVPTDDLDQSSHFAGMGPEPLGDGFTADTLLARLKGRRTPLKTALLDQRVVAGLGNIYVCEALFRARLSPRRLAYTLGPARAARLVAAIKDILRDAIAAGGSSLRDYVAADGSMGRFQHGFQVYDREGEPCPSCAKPVQRLTQSGRSTFFCAPCQR